MAIRTIFVPYVKGYDIGVGVDLHSGSRMAQSVEGEATSPQNAAGSTGDFEITRIVDTEDLEKSLGIDVEASYGCAAFAGVSARFNFAQNSRITSESLFMMVRLQVELSFLSVNTPKLTAAARDVADDASLFEARYGDMFVSGISRGGLLVAVLHMETRSAEEAMNMSGELEGSYALFSAEASTKLQEVQKKYNSSIKIRVYHEGGPVSSIVTELDDPKAFLTLAQNFATSFEQRPNEVAVPYVVSLSPVVIAEGPPPPNEAELQHASDVLVHCAKRRSAMLDALNFTTYVLDHPDRYDWTKGATLEQVKAASEAAQRDLDLIADTASAVLRDKASATYPEDFATKSGRQYPEYAPLNPPPVPIVGVDEVEVPSFENCASYAQAVEVAKNAGFTTKLLTVGEKVSKWTVTHVDPAPGAFAPKGSQLTITAPPLNAGDGDDRFRFKFDRDRLNRIVEAAQRQQQDAGAAPIKVETKVTDRLRVGGMRFPIKPQG